MKNLKSFKNAGTWIEGSKKGMANGSYVLKEDDYFDFIESGLEKKYLIDGVWEASEYNEREDRIETATFSQI